MVSRALCTRSSAVGWSGGDLLTDTAGGTANVATQTASPIVKCALPTGTVLPLQMLMWWQV